MNRSKFFVKIFDKKHFLEKFNTIQKPDFENVAFCKNFYAHDVSERVQSDRFAG